MPLLTPSERIGTTVAHRYRLTRLVGQGASAVLFSGFDLRLEREVAVKVMRPDGALSGAAERERFRGEALTLAKLRHPNLVEVYDVGETGDGMPCVVMELLHGESLAERLERHPVIAIQETLSIALPLMGALASAHALGVIHRDVKPANVFLHEAGSRGVIPKLLDFGIAKSEAGTGLTSNGLALGTPAYMAPEQARGESLGPQADVWAMGVMLFRMLSGRLPFEATTPAGVFWEATHWAAPSLGALVPDLDRVVAACVERALVADLARRHRDMSAFAEALTRTARRLNLALPHASELTGLPGYPAWCAATDAEIRTAPHETATHDAPVAIGPGTVRPAAATQATGSQRLRPPKRLVQATAVVALGATVAISAWGLRAPSQATPPIRTPAQASSEGARAPQAASIGGGHPEVPTLVAPAVQAPLAPSPTTQAESATKGHQAESARMPRRPKTKPLAPPAESSPADTAGPKPRIVTDFEW